MTFGARSCYCCAHFTMRAKTSPRSGSTSRKYRAVLQAPRFSLEPVLAVAHHTSKFLPRKLTQNKPHEFDMFALEALVSLYIKLYLQASHLISTSFPHQKLLLTLQIPGNLLQKPFDLSIAWSSRILAPSVWKHRKLVLDFCVCVI